MKLFHNLSKKTFAGLFAVVFGLLSISAAHAQILLTINDSDPSNVIITATGNSPATSVSPYLIADGVDLLGLFGTNVGFTNFTVNSSTLTTGDGSSGPVFTQASGDNVSPSNIDLNFYQNDTPATISFTTGQAAFSGSLSLNLSSTALPAVGSTGNIVAGFSGSPTTLIGQWQVIPEEVVPEPSTWALMLGGLGVLAFWRRGMRRA